VEKRGLPEFERALNLQRLGKFDQAATLYRLVLKAHPTHFDAAHMLGAAFLQQGRFDDAERQLRRALQIAPRSPEALNNLGLALRYLKRFEEAVAAFDRAIAFRPRYAQAYCNRGNALRLQGRLDEALESYDRAVALDATSPDAYYNRGGVLEDLQLWDDAAASYENALALMPDFPQALNNLGNALINVGRYEEALAAFNRALGLSLDNPDILTNRGNVFRELRQFAKALADHDAARAVKPQSADISNNRASTLREMGHLDEAVGDYHRALTLDPKHIEARANLALTELLIGNWATGFEGYELRFRKWRNRIRQPDCAAPLWAGEPLGGKSILLFAEQGFGDAIQFIRFVPKLLAEGARVTIQCDRRLHRLLATVAPGLEFVEEVIRDQPFDFQLALMSLARVLQVRPDTLRPHIPYLHAEPRRCEYWRTRLGEHGFKVGLAWQGNPVGSIDNGRSVPLRQFLPLSQLRGIRIISLQKNFGVEQLLELPAGTAIERPGFEFDEGNDAFIDTAAIMTNLDLVVSSDTSIAHLAGALGRPVWIALKYVPDWRWLMQRADSPWYPTARLFRQKKLDDWEGVANEIAAALKETAGRTGSPPGMNWVA
jgi:tetratricopeptide (TPR) repeat protein